MPKEKISHQYKIKIDHDKCKSCQLCIVHCPTKHIELSSEFNQRGLTYAKAKKDTPCIGCGFCFFICPECCIEVYEE
ncbi:MAG: 4Fe-4S binding protein [Candidatus Omnitrophica bacterium]|nr:4Fe-4S binding protein [Candidatus Omnitrophota bacterium]